MSYPEKFTGFGVFDTEEWDHPKKFTYEPKKFNDLDVDIKIDYCGVCGSDVHCAHGNWGVKYLPMVVGHEIVGKVIKVGPKVTSVKVGDTVGVGALVDDCGGGCDMCQSGNEQYCKSSVWTYFATYSDGYNTQGGYASHIRLPARYAYKIPEGLDPKYAAPLMCGGITCFSPLVRSGAGPGKKVGINGIGGIGHMAIMFAKALGAEVYAISRNDKKKEDVLRMGADHYIATNEENWSGKYSGVLDIVLNCGSSFKGTDMASMLEILRPTSGKFVSISVPEASETINITPFLLLGKSISQSALGNREELERLLQLCADEDIKPWIEEVPISEQGTHEVLARADKGDVKYRFVLTDYEKEFNDAY